MKKLLKERQQISSPHTPGGVSSSSSNSNQQQYQQPFSGFESMIATTPSIASPLESFFVTSPAIGQTPINSVEAITPLSATSSVYNNIVKHQMKGEGISSSNLQRFIPPNNIPQQGSSSSLPSMNSHYNSNIGNGTVRGSTGSSEQHQQHLNNNNGRNSSSSYPNASQNMHHSQEIITDKRMPIPNFSDMPLPSFSIPTNVIHSANSSPSVSQVANQTNASQNGLPSSHHFALPDTPVQSSTAQPNRPNVPVHSHPASEDKPIIEYMDDDDGWIAQWFNEDKRKKWKLKVPQFKYCKKRKEHFDKSFPETWYKAPYKYHMHLEVGNMLREENVLAQIDLNYEDGQRVLSQQKTKETKKSKKKKSKEGEKEAEEEKKSADEPVITNNESYFNYQSNTKSTVTIGPFMYNICSYKQEGKKFRMVVYLYTLTNTTPYHPFQTQPVDLNNTANAVLCCCLISPSFTIRAKKPIVKPGIKSKRKRGVDDDGESKSDDDMEEPTSPTQDYKRMKEPLNEESIPNFHPRANNQVSSNHEQPTSNTAATQAIDELLESLYRNNSVFDPQMVTGASSSVGSSSAASSSNSRQEAINTEEKIKNMTETFQNMADSDRKKLLGNIIESCYPHEKEFLYRKYFESGYSEYGVDPYYQSQNPQSSHVQTMLQQYQIIQQQQQDLYAYFAALNGNQQVQVMQVQPTFTVGSSSSGMPVHVSSSQMIQQQPPQQLQSQIPQQSSNPSALSFANNHQPSDVDQFFVELFD